MAVAAMNHFTILTDDLAKTNNTLIVPSNVSDVASILATAMTVLDKTKQGGTRS